MTNNTLPKNKLVMLIGLPGSGKTAFYNNTKFLEFEEKETYWIVPLSSDVMVEAVARVLDMTYDGVWSDVKGVVGKAFDRVVERTFSDKGHVSHPWKGEMVIWDQTNLTKKSRAKKLAKVPETWEKVAVYVLTPSEAEWTKRLQRPGKTIPIEVIQQMTSSFEPPSLDEGFKEIWTYDSEKDTLEKII